MEAEAKSPGRLQQWGTFCKEFYRNFETTGSILPSSRFLARAITRLPRQRSAPSRILEAGPGTGPFTDVLIRSLKEGDTLVLVELNDRFVEILSSRLKNDPTWAAKSPQVQIIHGPVEEIPPTEHFDAIVCGLPFNNFDPALVSQLFELFFEKLKADGTFSFFEYLAIRRVKMPFVGKTERERLKGVANAIDVFLEKYQVEVNRIGLNVPPAVVHHLKKTNGS